MAGHTMRMRPFRCPAARFWRMLAVDYRYARELRSSRASITSGCQKLAADARYVPNPSCLAAISVPQRRLSLKAVDGLSICPHVGPGCGHISCLPPASGGCWRWITGMPGSCGHPGHPSPADARSWLRWSAARCHGRAPPPLRPPLRLFNEHLFVIISPANVGGALRVHAGGEEGSHDGSDAAAPCGRCPRAGASGPGPDVLIRRG